MARKTVQQASFRGVQFQIFTTDSTFGRRLVDHTFVKRDTPYQEDLGRKEKEFRVEAFVVGDDYATKRDSLIAAFETEGPGQLIHPFYGSKMVSVRSCRVREAAGELGLARFDVEFIEAGQLLFPKAAADANAKLSDAVEGLRTATTTNFLEKYNVLAKPQFVVDSARSAVQGVANAITTQTSSFNKSADQVTDLAFAVRNLKADANTLVLTPAALRDRLGSALRTISSAIPGKSDSTKAYSGFYSYSPAAQTSPFVTVNRQAETQNTKAINDLVAEEALGQSALDASLISFSSLEDANKTRQIIFDEIENQKGSTDSDEVYAALLELKARVNETIPASTQALPYITTIQLAQSVPSLVLSYSLYDSLNLEQDIIDRNDVENPAFVYAGEPLKVLKDG